jgi:hypothetical protein
MAEPQQPSRPLHPKEMEQSLSIREYEQRSEALKMWIDSQLEHIKEVAEIEAEALKMALDLRASTVEKDQAAKSIELARRLDELNHAHKTAMENWARSLPRELFDSFIGEWNKWRSSIDTTLITHQQIPIQIAELSSRTMKEIASLESRTARIEGVVQRTTGAFILLGLMGASGVVALAISLMRLAGAVR